MTFEIVYGMLRISCSMRTGDSVGAFYVFPYISGKTEPTSDIIRIFVTLNIIRMKTKKKDSFMDTSKRTEKEVGKRRLRITVIRSVSTGYMYRKRFITVKEIRQMPGGICLICTLSFATISAGGCVPDIFP